MSISADSTLRLKSIHDFPPAYARYRFYHLFDGPDDPVGKKAFLLYPFDKALKQLEWKVNHMGEWRGEDFFILDGFETVGYLQWFASQKASEQPLIELGFFIRKESRGKGLGTWAIQALEEKVWAHESHVTLCPVSSNFQAIKLYKRLGYKIEKNPLAESKGFVFMTKDL